MSDIIAAIYSRKSRFTGTGESVENQIQICCEYIKLHFPGSVVRYEVYEDEGFSGRTMKRPAMEKLLQKAVKGEIDIFVCYRLDRVSRSVSDFADFIEMLNVYGIKFISVRENFDTTTPMGRAMIHIASVFAQLERETIAERITDNMLSLARNGHWLGGETPTGFKSEIVEYKDENQRLRHYHRLSVVSNEAEIVKLIFRKYIEFGSVAEVRRFFEKESILTKNKVLFGDYSLKFILKNPVYCRADKIVYEYLTEQGYHIYSDEQCFDGRHALIAYNRTNENKQKGFSNRYNSIDEWIIAVGEHKGIIEGNNWIKVQELFRNTVNCSRRIPSKVNGTGCLSGILYCGECGALMRPKTTGTINPDGSKRYYYMCERKSNSKGALCNMNNVQGNSLDEMVCGEIINLFLKLDDMVKSSDIDNYYQIKSSLRKSITEAVNLVSNSRQYGKKTTLNEFLINNLSVKDKSRYLKSIVKRIEWNGNTAYIHYD